MLLLNINKLIFLFDLMPIIKVLKEFSFFVVSLGRIGSNNNYGTIASNITLNQLRKQSRRINEKTLIPNTIQSKLNQQNSSTIKSAEINVKLQSEESVTFDEVFIYLFSLSSLKLIN